MERLKRMPVPVLPTFVGALTLGNVFAGMGFDWVRHLTMWTATVILILYLIKIIRYPGTCAEEYKQVIPCSLYAALFMIMMILGGYYFEFVPVLGKTLWIVAVVCHAVHILIFTYRNVIQKRDVNTFMPCWYVTYNGIMVSCVVGGVMNMKPLLTVITYYGIVIYLVLLPFLLVRLIKVEVKDGVYHTMAVLLAPCSLCVVSYINVIENPNMILLGFLYICVLASLVFVIIKLPKFFSFRFTPGYAGITFPMAIGCVATGKMAGVLANAGYEGLSAALSQLQGIQIYLTVFIIGYVLIQFLISALRIERK